MNSKEKSMDLSVDFEKERKKVKDIRKKYTIGEIKIIIKFYDKNKSIRETARKFNIPYSTVQGWIHKEELYKTSEALTSSLRLNPGGRKSDTADYDDILLSFIKEARSQEITIISTEVINKEIVPDFKEKSYNSLHNWFKRFSEKYSYSIRNATKLAQKMPKNSLENIHEYLFKAIKNNF